MQSKVIILRDCHNLIILDKNRENCPYDLTDGSNSF